MIAAPVARILPVADQNRLRCRIDIGPFDAADLLLAQGGRDREPDDASHGQRDAGIPVAVIEQGIDLGLRRATIAFGTLADETEAPQRDAREIDSFGRVGQAMHGGAVRDQRAQIAEVDAERHGPRAFGGALLPERDEAFATDIGKAQATETIPEQLEAEPLRATELPADLREVCDMQVDQIRNRRDVAHGTRQRRDAEIEIALDSTRPFSASLRIRKVSPYERVRRRTCARHLPEGSRVKVAIVCTLCAVSGRGVSQKRVQWRTKGERVHGLRA